MNELFISNCSNHNNDDDLCPTLLSIISSIANQEDALACILNAECAKINRIVSTYSDIDALIAIDNSVQTTLQRITELEGVLQAKLNAILPFLNKCSEE